MKQDKIRVAFYMRVSTAEQANGFSLDMQELALKEHVKRNGYKNWETDVRWHFSEQQSGGDMERGELKRMLGMAKKGEFDLVVVWKIDRISRSLTDLLEIFETLNKYGVGFASFKEDIDFTGPVGKLIFQIFGALAEFERENIRMRTEEGKRMSAKQGNYVGGSEPYGYKRVANKADKGSKLVPVPDEAKIVKQVFEWFVFEKKTLAEIASKLNAMGISKGQNARKGTKHTKWQGKLIRAMLENETYRGAYITNRIKIIQKKPRRTIERPKEEWIISPVPAIVNNSLYMTTQEQLNGGRKGKRGGGGGLYMLSGKLYDVETGKGFTGYLSAKETKNYRRKKFTDENGVVHKTMSLAAKGLENFVWNYAKQAILKPKVFLEIHRKNSKNSQRLNALSAKYNINQKAFSDANERLERVDRDYYNGEITKERQKELKAKFEPERDHNLIQMKKIEKEIASLGLYDVACKDLKKFSENMKEGIDNLTYEQKCNIVQMVVERVEIRDEEEKRKARVFFRFDQKAIASVVSEGRTDLELEKAKKTKKSNKKVIDGGR